MMGASAKKKRNDAATPPGTRFGRLVVIELLPERRHRNRMYLCLCDCGTKAEVHSHSLRAGVTTSCGCFRDEVQKKAVTRHGLGVDGKPALHDPTYLSWHSARRRARRGAGHYANVGFSPVWDDYAQFLRDVGPRPKGTTLDRIDNERGYEPGNVRWATAKEQANNRRNTLRVEVDGVTRSVSEWSDLSKTPQYLIRSRLRAGWEPSRLFAPSSRASRSQHAN